MNGAARRGVMLLAIVFASGVVTGVAADRIRRPQTTLSTRVTMNVPDVLGRLELTEEQRRATAAILERSSPRSEAAMREIVPRLAAIADSVNAELAHVLTPVQRARLDSLTSGPLLLLKRKTPNGASRVDTVFKR